MTTSNVMARLREGNLRFKNSALDSNLQDGARRAELTETQEPWAIVLSCADSRVVPEVAFDTGLGELFVVRVAGNIANTSSVASIEYCVQHCGSRVIVVMGHQGCGAVGAAMAGGDNGPHLNTLVEHILPAIDATPDDASKDDIIKKNAELIAEKLVSDSEILADYVANHGLLITPAYYSLESGEVQFPPYEDGEVA